ncbi:MAG: RNA polymerase sigma factor [Thermodesulfobacteriota bacterium]
MEYDKDSVSRWVLEAVNGSEASFHRLMDLYYKGIFRMIFYRIQSKMDAEDITQEVFFQAYNRLNSLQSPDRFKSWLFSIALNKVRDFIRKKKFRSLFQALPENLDLESEGNPGSRPSEAHEQLERTDFWNMVTHMMTGLSNKEREVFTLRFFDNLSIREISQVMDKGESTIKTFLYRAMLKIKNNPSLQKLAEETMQ